MTRGGLVIIVAAAGLLAACKGGAGANDALSNVGESWCPEGFEAGPNDTCFAIPEKAAKDTPVLVYLHGTYRGRGDPAEFGAVRGAVERGFAVVIPRGKRGLCAWRAELRDNFCWPQDPEDTDAIDGLVAEWGRVLWQVDTLLEPGTHERYVLGLSNGGSFAQYLAARGGFPARAYAIVDGGPLVALPAKADPGAPAMLLLSAPDDVDQGPKMKALRDGLSSAGWPHGFCTRPGGHALTSGDVDRALRFFEHARDGSLGTAGAPYACEPQPRR